MIGAPTAAWETGTAGVARALPEGSEDENFCVYNWEGGGLDTEVIYRSGRNILNIRVSQRIGREWCPTDKRIAIEHGARVHGTQTISVLVNKVEHWLVIAKVFKVLKYQIRVRAVVRVHSIWVDSRIIEVASLATYATLRPATGPK